MTKNEVLRDIEEKLKNIGYSNDNEIKILVDYYFQVLEEGKGIKSINLIDKHKEDLENIYKKRIENEKKKIEAENFIETEKIKVIITTASLANVSSNILEELPLEKTLRVCKNVKRVYLFYSKEASEKYKLIEKKINSRKIDVNLKLGDKAKLETDSIVSMRAFLFDVLKQIKKDDNVKENEILIDLTVGMKLASIAMYKIAVENGIKTINWKEVYFSKYKKINDNKYEISTESHRIVFSATFEIIKEILDENKQILLDINDSIVRKEYQAVADLYKKIDRKNEEKFYKEISKIMDKDLFYSLNINMFSYKLKEFVKNILDMKDLSQSFKERIKPLILYFKIITDFDIKDSDNYNKEFIMELKNKYKNFMESQKYEGFLEKFLEKHYINEMKNLDFNIKDFKDILFNEELLLGIEDTIEDDADGIYLPEGYSLKNLYLYLIGINIVESLSTVKKLLFKDTLRNTETKSIYHSLFFERDLESYYLKKLFENEEEQYRRVKKMFSLETLKEKVDNTLEYQEGILRIGKYDIIINLKKEGIKVNNFSELVLMNILKNKNKRITKEELLLLKGNKLSKKTFNKYKTEFNKNIVDVLNEIITKTLRENNNMKMGEKEEFIKIRHQNEKNGKEWIYKINEKFF